jgi:hypothetical protein
MPEPVAGGESAVSEPALDDEAEQLGLTGAAETLLRQAIADYARDAARADFIIHFACTQALNPLPAYRVIYKFYHRQRRLDLALDFADRALLEAARQCGLPLNPESWNRKRLDAARPDTASQALQALKAMAFLELRRGNDVVAGRHLAILRLLDPEDGTGVSVVSALADSSRGRAAA